MKLTQQDWKILQMPLVMLAAVTVAMGALVAYTHYLKEQATKELQAQQSQLNQARTRLEASGAEKSMIAQYMPLYLDLVRRGFIGEERRIEWIDNLRTINQNYKLFGINYTIGAQEPYKAPFSVATGPFVLNSSEMKLETPLLHEGDLATILKAMSDAGHAPFLVRDCVLTRSGSGARNKFLPNLNATCEIEWLTVTEPSRMGSKP